MDRAEQKSSSEVAKESCPTEVVGLTGSTEIEEGPWAKSLKSVKYKYSFIN